MEILNVFFAQISGLVVCSKCSVKQIKHIINKFKFIMQKNTLLNIFQIFFKMNIKVKNLVRLAQKQKYKSLF